MPPTGPTVDSAKKKKYISIFFLWPESAVGGSMGGVVGSTMRAVDCLMGGVVGSMIAIVVLMGASIGSMVGAVGGSK